jgi:hypothetical protein
MKVINMQNALVMGMYRALKKGGQEDLPDAPKEMSP